MSHFTRKQSRSLWASLGLVALLLVPYAIRYSRMRLRVERDIEATEKEQKEWIARDRAEGEAMMRRAHEIREEALRRHRLSTQPTTGGREGSAPDTPTTLPTTD